MRLPISCVTSMAVSCHAPAVSIIIIIVVVVVDTGWLYVQSASVFRRLLDVGVRRAMADVINATVAVPMLELTVGVRDGGSPPRSTLVRLLVVAASDPDGEPVIISSTSSFHSLMWIQRLFIVVGSALGAAVLAAIVFTVVVSCVLFTHATRQGVDISLIGYSVCVCVCVCVCDVERNFVFSTKSKQIEHQDKILFDIIAETSNITLLPKTATMSKQHSTLSKASFNL